MAHHWTGSFECSGFSRDQEEGSPEQRALLVRLALCHAHATCRCRTETLHKLRIPGMNTPLAKRQAPKHAAEGVLRHPLAGSEDHGWFAPASGCVCHLQVWA